MNRIVALLVALAFLLTGCSGGDGGDGATPVTGDGTMHAGELSASSTTFPMTVTHPSGSTDLEAAPQRIVVLDMAALDTIDAVGAGERVVGTATDSVPTWLSDADGIDYTHIDSVGTLKEPDVEAIVRLKPDLVILGARSASFFEEFSKVFPTIDASVSWDGEGYSERAVSSVEQVATVVGEAENGKALAADIADEIETYSAMAEGKGNALVVMSNAGEISVHNSSSRWAPIFDIFGFEEAYAGSGAEDGHKGDKVSFETIKEINPDWMFVVDRDAAVGGGEAGDTAAEVLDNELVAATNAAKNGRIVYLSPERWYVVMTGATNFPAMLGDVAHALEKDEAGA